MIFGKKPMFKYFMKYFLITFLLFVYSFNLNAQSTTHSISGKITNSNHNGISDVSIALISLPDNKTVGGTISEDDGSFEISTIPEGNYKLKVSALGYQEYIKNSISINNEHQKINIGTITLKQSEQALKEVAVVGEKNLMQMDIDKKIFNVDKNITATGGSAADVLQNIPSVSVDPSGNVSLRGKSNVNILIDGRPATLLGGDVASALQALPATSIDNVEVITNPSSKYDAQGQTGIINIVTKVNKNSGINGNATLGIGTNSKYNGGLNLNYRTAKWNISLNSNFRLHKNFHSVTTDRNNYNNDSGSHNFEDGRRSFNGNFNALTVAYTIDSQNTLSLTQNINLMEFGNKGYQQYNLFSNPSAVYSTQRRDQSFKGSPFSTSNNLNWKHKFKKPKTELVTDVSFSNSNTDIHQHLKSYFLDSYYNNISGNTLQEVNGLSHNQTLNIQSDFSTYIHGGKLESGVKNQDYWFNSKNDALISYPNGTSLVDPLLQNQYQYQQQIFAAYTNYNNKWNKWSYQGGLRAEYAVYNGHGGNTGNLYYKNSFLNLFPTAYLSYQIKEQEQIYLNYSRRTDRPWFRELLPYLNISNGLDTTSGNPNLKPEFIDNFELAYNLQLPKGHNIMASVYFQNTNNLSQRYTKSYADGTSFTQSVNMATGQTYGFELITKFQILKPWDATLSTNLFYNKINGANVDPSLVNQGFSWFSKLNTNYKINKNISLQLMANYESPKPVAQGKLQEVYWIDAAFKANFLKNNRASVTFNVSDIFNTRKYTTNYTLSLYDQRSYNNRETQIATLTFNYKIGKLGNGDNGNGFMRWGKKGKGDSNKKELERRDGNLNGAGADDNQDGA